VFNSLVSNFLDQSVKEEMDIYDDEIKSSLLDINKLFKNLENSTNEENVKSKIEVFNSLIQL
jgi:hypothetical protein